MLRTRVLDVERIRQDFPILNRKINGKRLVYLDSAATAQKPLSVINAVTDFYKTYNANVHRGIYKLSEEATERFDESREKVRKFINAKNSGEIVFTRNATESINLVMYSWGLNNLKAGDEIILSVMEHHSNLVPWQFLQRKGVVLKFVDINDDGTLKMEDYDKLVTKKTKMVSVVHVSNALGTINPVKEIGKIAHDNGALFFVDGAQSVPHMPVNVQNINCDFLALSGHKMMGPTGSGALYGKSELLEKMEPFMFGGEMIKEVHLKETKFNELPHKFEAGTPNIAGAIGLGSAVDYLNMIGVDNVREHEKELISYALKKSSEIDGITVYGPGNIEIKGGVFTFNLGDVHPHDLASILDNEGIAIRSGHHCAQPLMERLGVMATSRASFYIYNTKEEIDILMEGLNKARDLFK